MEIIQLELGIGIVEVFVLHDWLIHWTAITVASHVRVDAINAVRMFQCLPLLLLWLWLCYMK